ncbi:MAG: hypothetical protein JXQ76_07540 [Campylobacterales bacterium]|nr:hypothetical protein [Campylobacterales bacterium]
MTYEALMKRLLETEQSNELRIVVGKDDEYCYELGDTVEDFRKNFTGYNPKDKVVIDINDKEFGLKNISRKGRAIRLMAVEL